MSDRPPQPHHLLKLARNREIPFGALRAITQLRALLDRWEEVAIASAREKGASWSDIAENLGITRQALQQRIARHARPGPSADEQASG